MVSNLGIDGGVGGADDKGVQTMLETGLAIPCFLVGLSKLMPLVGERPA